MGVGAGGFRMNIETTRTVNFPNLTEQEICLAGAYAQSARQDRLIASDFESGLFDGLTNEPDIYLAPSAMSEHLDKNRNLCS